MREGKKCNKIVSLVLAAVMMVSVFAVATPQQVEAAEELSFNGKGSTTVSISDADCYAATEEANYIKFKPSVTGYITVTVSNNSNVVPDGAYGYITFCNSKKTALGTTREAFDTAGSVSAIYTRTYGVKKGSTYYLRVESAGGVKIKASVTSVKKGTNTSRAKAKTLKKNATVKGVIIAGENKADWYKIKLTKKQQVRVVYSSKTNGLVLSSSKTYYSNNGIKITLCKSNGKPYASGSSNYDLARITAPSGTGTYYVQNQYGQKSGVDVGTYYIKVERYNRTSSGYYTIKWK